MLSSDTGRPPWASASQEPCQPSARRPRWESRGSIILTRAVGVLAAGSKTPGRRAVVGYGRLPGWQRSDSRRIFAGCRLNAPTPFALSASQSAMMVSWYSLVASASNYWERTMCTRSSGVPFLPASYRGNSSSRIRRIIGRAPACAFPNDGPCAT
jgi:hypothetical protein